MRAISSSVTRSPQQGILLLFGSQLLLLGQLLLQLGQAAIFQLGGLVQVIFPLCLLNGCIGLLDLLPQRLHLANGVFLIFPAGFHAAEVVLQLCQLLFQLPQAALAQGIGLLFQADLLDLQLR